MTWELKHVVDVECTMDDSGLYTVIHRVIRPDLHKEYAGERIEVRADLMTAENQPLMSWQGTANNVRKHLIAYIHSIFGFCQISMEHASYIGYELHRAETDENYVQD